MPEIISTIFEIEQSLKIEYPEEMMRNIINNGFNLIVPIDSYTKAFYEWVNLFVLTTMTGSNIQEDTEEFIRYIYSLDRTTDCVLMRLNELKDHLNKFELLKYNCPHVYVYLWKQYDEAQVYLLSFIENNSNFIRDIQDARDIDEITELLELIQ